MMLQAILASAAARERDSRERGYPALIEAGKITAEDAAADIVAWRALAEIFERGSTERDISWSTLHLATSRCLQALERDVERAHDPDKLRKATERRDFAAAIHARVDRQKYLVDDTNALLRKRADRKQEAA